jgi:hypothetical protein
MMMRTNCKIINETRSFGDMIFSRAQGCEGNSKGMPYPHRMLDTMLDHVNIITRPHKYKA